MAEPFGFAGFERHGFCSLGSACKHSFGFAGLERHCFCSLVSTCKHSLQSLHSAVANRNEAFSAQCEVMIT